MKANQNVTMNHGQVNQSHEMGDTPKNNSRIRTLKRKNMRLKATIRALRESRVEQEKILKHVVGEYAKKRDLAWQLTAAMAEAKELMYKAHEHAFKSFQEANSALIKLTETQIREDN